MCCHVYGKHGSIAPETNRCGESAHNGMQCKGNLSRPPYSCTNLLLPSCIEKRLRMIQIIAYSSLTLRTHSIYNEIWLRLNTSKYRSMYIRAGELPKKFCQGVQTWHMGLKNVSKKFGTPGPNLAPTHFGLFGQGQITKASTPKWVCRTLKICLFYNFYI